MKLTFSRVHTFVVGNIYVCHDKQYGKPLEEYVGVAKTEKTIFIEERELKGRGRKLKEINNSSYASWFPHNTLLEVYLKMIYNFFEGSCLDDIIVEFDPYDCEKRELKFCLSKEYEYVEINYESLTLFSDIFKTKKINVGEKNYFGGCETCDHGSRYEQNVWLSEVDETIWDKIVEPYQTNKFEPLSKT